jgi:hypothetical protein
VGKWERKPKECRRRTSERVVRMEGGLLKYVAETFEFHVEDVAMLPAFFNAEGRQTVLPSPPPLSQPLKHT